MKGKFKSFLARDTKTWRKLVVKINAANSAEFREAAWWVSETLWNTTRAPMYFARYSLPDGPMRVEVRIDLLWTKRQFKALLAKAPRAPVKCEVISVEKCEGSVPHIQAWALAMSLRGKSNPAIHETLHWFYNMIGCSYLEEVKMACEQATGIINILAPAQ